MVESSGNFVFLIKQTDWGRNNLRNMKMRVQRTIRTETQDIMVLVSKTL